MKEDMNKCKHCGYLIEPMKGCGLGKDALDRVKRSQRDIIYISFAQGKRDNLQSVPSVVGSITFVIHPWVFLTAALLAGRRHGEGWEGWRDAFLQPAAKAASHSR